MRTTELCEYENMALNATTAPCSSSSHLLEVLQELSIVSVFGTLFALSLPVFWWLSRGEPPSLDDAIPFVSNTYQYLTDNSAFLKRAS